MNKLKRICANAISTVVNQYRGLAAKWEKLFEMRFTRFIFKFLPKNIIVFIFLVLSIFTLAGAYSEREHKILHQDVESTGNVGEVYNESVELPISEKEFDDQFEFDKIGIRFATYQRQIDADYKFELLKENKVVYSENFNTKKLSDLSLKFFNVGTLNSKDLDQYRAVITPIRASQGSAVTIMTNGVDNLINMTFAKSTPFLSTRMLILFAFFICFLGINFLINTKKINHHNFSLLMFIYIVSILFVTPPYQVPDEPYHFDRAKAAAQYTPELNIHDNFVKREVSYPSFTCLNYSKLNVLNNVLDSSEIVECAQPKENVKQVDEKNGTTAILGTVVPGIGVKIGDLLSNAPLMIFYIGRIFCLLVSMLIVYTAVKIVPKYKNMFLLLGTMPMVVQAAISYSYDSILNGICLLFVALFVKLKVEKPKLNWKYYLLFSALFVVILNIKIVYAPLGILLFFIPKESFKSNAVRWRNIFIILLAALATHYIFSYLIGYDQPLSIIDTSSKSNFEYLMANPFEIFNVAFETLATYGTFYIKGLIGYFGWFYFKMDNIFIIAYLIMFLVLIYSEESILSGKEKIINFICNMIIIAGVFAALYFSWTPYKGTFIEGVQGRYFLPLLIPIFLCFMCKNKKINLKSITVYSFINIVMLQYIGLLLLNYY